MIRQPTHINATHHATSLSWAACGLRVGRCAPHVYDLTRTADTTLTANRPSHQYTRRRRCAAGCLMTTRGSCWHGWGGSHGTRTRTRTRHRPCQVCACACARSCVRVVIAALRACTRVQSAATKPSRPPPPHTHPPPGTLPPVQKAVLALLPTLAPLPLGVWPDLFGTLLALLRLGAFGRGALAGRHSLFAGATSAPWLLQGPGKSSLGRPW